MLDPLKFEVAIKDRATKELEEIEKKLINKLNGKNALSDVMSRSFKVAKNEVERLQNELVRAQRVIETFGDKGFNVASLERYKMALLEVRNNLELIKKNGGLHPQTGLTASQFLTSEDTSRVVSLLKTELSYYQNIGKELERIAHLRSALTSTMQAYPSSPYRSELSQAIAGLDLREGLLARQGVRDATQTINSSAYRQQIQEAVALISKVSAESRNSAKENAQMIESMRRAGIAVSDLAAKFDKLEIAKIRANAVAAKIDTSAYDKAVERMERYKRVLDYIAQHGGHDAKRITGSVGYRNAANDLNIQATALRTLTTEANRAAHATQQLSSEEQRLSQALQQTNDHARGQSQLLSDLKSLATQYLGVWGGQQFLHNIIEIGGQLEMQRLSIGAILQNTAQANELFDKIKGLATQSPFGVVQLDQMTKQLTAYGFKYNELYDMTKRLADISAATGTDVSRLALALGHVRSEAALSGYTLRQFSMANVPLLQKLSEKLGKTTKEIRDMVKKKEVGYDDVIGVLKDLTNEGGMFYNMQEVISESVKAKFKNVRDAMDIMYGEMAEGAPGDALKEVANMLMEVTRNWKDAVTILGTGAAVWGIHRVAIMLYTKILGQANYATLAAIANSSRQVAMNNTLAWTYRNLTASEKSHTIVSQAQLRIAKLRQTVGLQLSRLQALRIAQSRREIVMGLAVALSEKKLVAEDISRQVALGKVTRAEALRAIGLSRLSAAEKAAAVQMVNNTRILGFWGKAGYAAAFGIRAIGTALKSLIFNPAMMAMAAITAIMELWQRNSREMEAAEELSNKIYEHSQEALRNTRTMMENTGIHVKWRENDKSEWSDVTGSFGNKVGGQQTIQLPKFETTAAEQSIEQWSQYIREYAATPNRILNDALFDTEGKVRSLKEQYDNLGKSVIQVAEAQRLMQSMSLGDAFGNAIAKTDGGWFDDNVMTDIANYDKKLKKFGSNVTSVYRKYRQAVDSGIRAAERQDATFAEATKGLDTYAQKFKFLVEHQKEYVNSWSAFRNVGGLDGISNQNALSEASTSSAFRTGFDEVEKAKAEMQSELNDFFLQLEGELEMKGIDKKKIQESEALQQALLLSYKDNLSSIQGLSAEAANDLMKLFAQWFGIKLDVDDEKFKVKVSEVQRILKELSESDWNVDLNFASNMNDVIKEARKQYKAAKEFYENAEPVLIKFGVKMKMGDVLTEEQIKAALAKAPENARGFLEQVLRGANEASRLFNQSTTASKTGGFSLKDKTKKEKSNRGGKKKDTVLEGWKEEWNELKAFYTEYKRWAEKIGDDKAIEKLRSTGLWGQFFNKDGSARYSMKDWGQAIDDFKKQLKGGTKDRDKFLFEVGKERLTPDFDQISKNLDEQLKAMEKYLSENAEKYDLYRYLLEQTGNESFASLAFGDYRMWDDASKKARKHLEKSWGSAISNWNMDESQAEKFFGGNKAMLKAYTEIQGNIRKKGVDLLKEEAQALNKTLDIDGKIALKEAEIERIRKEGGNNDGRIKQAQEELKGLQTEKFQQAPEFLKFYDAVLTMSIDEAENMGLAIRKNLTEQLANSRISAKNFLTEIKKIDEQIKKVRSKKGDLFNLMTGGLDEMLQQRSNKAVDRYQSAAIDYENAQRDLEKAQRNNDSTGVMNALLRRRAAEEEMKTAKKVFNLSDKQLDNLNQVVKICKMIDDIVRGIGEGFENVRQAADSLGVDTDRNAWTSINGVLGAISGVTSSISGIAQSVKNGDIGGVISNTVGMFTKPIVALSEAHDKRREHQIEQLREDVHKIDNTLNLIKLLRSRTLGYDNGDLRRSMANMYAQRSGASAQGMYEYYSRGGLRGTGYRQEIDALRKQREDYQKMYDAENDKKKKSSESLEEYKVKMAELDEQIQNYAEDLSKELWGIDFQSWADQLGDAIMTAFENGEDMARAFNDAVKSIMQDIVSEVLKIGIIEPMMERLRNKLFGDNGVVSTDEIVDDPVAASRKLVNALGEYFKPGGEGSNMVNAANNFLSGVNGMMKQMGFSNGLLGDDSSKSVSSGIKGIQEQTADLLASYINAIRQDVSVIRMQEDTLYKEFISNYWSSYISHVTGIEGRITSIQNNTAAIVRMMESGQGALYEKVNRIEDHLDSVIHGANKMNVK